MTARVRTAIVGTGSIAAQHVQGLRELSDRVDLVAVADVDLSKAHAFAELHGAAKAYPTLTEMLERERPDLVQICTPPRQHVSQVVQSLRGGALVLCEKPLTLSLAECDRIERAEKETGRFCSTVFQWRFGSAAQYVKRLLDGGVLGSARVVAGMTNWFRDDAYYDVPWRGKWETEGGGPTLGHGIHCVDFVVWLLGGWVQVNARLGRLVRDVETEDVSVAAVEFRGGALGTLVTSVLSPRQETRLRIDCERATIELVHLYGYTNANWQVTPAEGCEDVAQAWRELAEDQGSTHAAQLRHVLDCLESGARPLTSGYGARSTMEVVTAIYRSGITGAPTVPADLVPADPFYHQLHGGAKGWAPVPGALETL